MEAHAVNLVTFYAIYYLQKARDHQADIGFTCDVVVDSDGTVAALLLMLALLLL